MENYSFFGFTKSDRFFGSNHWRDFTSQLGDYWTEIDAATDYNGDVYKLLSKEMVRNTMTGEIVTPTKIYALELNGLIFAVSLSVTMLQRSIDEIKRGVK